MKPIRLTIEAFLVFKDKQVIDFTKLDDHNLFLIHGKTGAGKTTILDAICFALYNKASNDKRHVINGFRSPRAKDDVPTSVELIFELGGQTYRVFRQAPHVRQGNKNATGDRMEFGRMVDGVFESLADRARATEQTRLVEEMIGLSYSQFCKIVMLPQGEFAELLVSSSGEKEAILRKIFDTHELNLILKELQARQKSEEANYKMTQGLLNDQLNNVKLNLSDREGSALQTLFQAEAVNVPQVLAALEEEGQFLQTEASAKSAEAVQADEALQQATLALNQADELANSFARLDVLRERLAELAEQAEAFAKRKERLQLADRAQGCQSAEALYEQAATDAAVKEKLVEERREALAAAKQASLDANEAYKKEEAKASQRQTCVSELDRLERLRPEVERFAEAERTLEGWQKDLQATIHQLARAVQTATEQETACARVRADVLAKEKDADQLGEVMSRAAALRSVCTLLANTISAQEKVSGHDAEVGRLQARYDKLAEACSELEGRWIAEYAGMLAQHLHDGDACPVCGNAQHPQKAQLSPGAPSREEVDAKASEKAEAHGLLVAERRLLEDAQTSLTALIDEVVQGGYDATNLAEALQEMTQTRAEWEAKEKVCRDAAEQLQTLRQSLVEHEQKSKDCEKAVRDLENAAADWRVKVAGAQNTVDELSKQLSEDLRTLAQLEGRIAEVEEEKRALEQAWKAAQTLQQTAQVALAQAETGYTEAQTQLSEAQTRKTETGSVFEAEFRAAGFETVAAYGAAKLDKATMDTERKAVQDYEGECSSTQAVFDSLNDSLAEKQRPDVEALATEVKAKKTLADEIAEQVAAIRDRISKVITAQTEIANKHRAAEEAASKYGVVFELSEALSGKNEDKVAFERYLQMEYLDRIVHAANDRLQTLSNGHFFLVRSGKRARGNAKSGLDFDVYDTYTEEYRPVQTLSGGEKFNASLCLALGMADIIQSHGGGVSIDTMFIDEGFGSLDADSVNKAYETLYTLQESGRMLAVISHLKEMHDLIPAKMKVRKRSDGTSEVTIDIE